MLPRTLGAQGTEAPKLHFLPWTRIFDLPLLNVFLTFSVFKLLFHFALGKWVFCLFVCLWPTCMPMAYGSQKRVLYPLQLGSQMVVNHCISAGH